jgi:hypothetical protein
MKGVEYFANRDSLLIQVPAVDGVRDYRVFAIPDGVTIEKDKNGGELVKGATIYCAGIRQAPRKIEDTPFAVMRQIEVYGITGPTRLVVEGISEQCPFPGVVGSQHVDVKLSGNITSDDRFPVKPDTPMSVFTEDEVRARYGSMIINGQAPGPFLTLPAEPLSPKVLARTTVLLTPQAADVEPPAKQFFDDFSAADDVPVFIPKPTTVAKQERNAYRYMWQNSKWNFLAYDVHLLGDKRTGAQTDFVLERGHLKTLLADNYQDVFGSHLLIPKQPVQLDDKLYLHVTFEVDTNSSDRRYWWLTLCGAAEAGKTILPDGQLAAHIQQTPFFYQDDGQNPSIMGWNCLQAFPRDGGNGPLPPDNKRPESDITIIVNRPGPYAVEDRDNVVNVSPNDYRQNGSPAWYRTHDESGAPNGVMLDDLYVIAPRVRFDFYIRRDRVIMYANGKQKLCNDFPKQKLTMAEGALGYGSVLYHSSAEYTESQRARTGQRYYQTNTPFLDVRHWDNLGYDEKIGAPASFNEKVCYVSTK